MTDQGMRGLLAALEADDELHRVKRPVDLQFEIASVLSLRRRWGGATVRTGRQQSVPVVANVLNSRDRIARGLGIKRKDLHERCLAALRERISPVVVDRGRRTMSYAAASSI